MDTGVPFHRSSTIDGSDVDGQGVAPTAPEAYLSHHALEPAPTNRAGRRAAEVLVDDFDLAESQRMQPRCIAYCSLLLSWLLMT